jgi:hypothetical protein
VIAARTKEETMSLANREIRRLQSSPADLKQELTTLLAAMTAEEIAEELAASPNGAQLLDALRSRMSRVMAARGQHALARAFASGIRNPVQEIGRDPRTGRLTFSTVAARGR